MKLIKEIMNLLFGYKYRAVILKDRGVERYWICSYIFEDTPAGNVRLRNYLQKIEDSVMAHTYYETISFRSRNEYGGILTERENLERTVFDKLKKDSEEMRRYHVNKNKNE